MTAAPPPPAADDGWGAPRAFWLRLRAALEREPALACELLEGLAAVLGTYGTAVYENRFVVGGVAEQLLGSAARAGGLPVRNVGRLAQGHDLEVSGEDPHQPLRLSVKGVFASSASDLTLLNTQGASDRAWAVPTLVLLRDVGLGYADPGLLPGKVQVKADSLRLPLQHLHELWNTIAGARPPPPPGQPLPDTPGYPRATQWLLPRPVPTAVAAPAREVASDLVSARVMASLPRLRPHLQAEQ